MEQYIIAEDEFDERQYLSGGESGTVSFARHKRTGAKCTLKRIETDFLTDTERESRMREAIALAQCGNMFVVDFYGFTQTPPFIVLTQMAEKAICTTFSATQVAFSTERRERRLRWALRTEWPFCTDIIVCTAI
jgi:hypothetical protein